MSKNLSEGRRLITLTTLRECPAYEASESFIAIALKQLGYATPGDMVRIELAWLRDAALIEIEEVAGLMIARLTRRGLDAADGNAVIPGVRRPAPEGSR